MTLRETPNGLFWFCDTCLDRFPVLDASSPLADVHLLLNLPSIIAIPFDEYVRENHPVQKLHRLCDAVEILTRFLTIVAIAEVRGCSGKAGMPADLQERLAANIFRPTFGQWQNMLTGLSDWLRTRDDVIVPEALSFVSDDLFPFLSGQTRTIEDSLLTLRNDLVHGGGMTNTAARALLLEWHNRVEILLKALSFLNETKVIHINDGQFFQLIGVEADGQAIVLSEEETVATTSFDGHVVMLRQRQSLDLWPLCDYGVARSNGPKGLREAGGSSPQIYFRHEPDRLLFAAIGVDLHRGERYDVLAEFAALFQAAKRGPIEKAQPADCDQEVLADGRRVTVRLSEVQQAKGKIKEMDHGVCWVGGPAGIGKSFLLAKLASDGQISMKSSPKKSCCIIWRFRAGDDRRCNKTAFLEHGVRQLIRWLTEDIKIELPSDIETKDSEASLTVLLNHVALLSAPTAQGNPPRVTFYIDGMDEIERVDPSVLELPFRLQKPNCLWICVGRPERAIPSVFSPDRCRHLFEGGLPPMSDADIRAILVEETGALKYELLGLDREVLLQEGLSRVTNPFVDAIVARASGLPLYVHYIVQDLISGELSFTDLPTRLPPGLNAYFDVLLRRLSIGDMAVLMTRLTALVMGSKLPLPEDALRLLLQREGDLGDDEEAATLLRRALSLLRSIIQPMSLPNGRTGWEPYHESFRDYLRQAPTFRNENVRAQQSFCNLTCAWYELPETHSARDYALRVGIKHLLEAGQWKSAAELLIGFDFPAAKVAADLTFDLIRDYHAALAGGAEVDNSLRGTLKDWARFIDAEGHNLHVYPGLFLQQALNQPANGAVSKTAVARYQTHASEPELPYIFRLGYLPPRSASSSLIRTMRGHESPVHAIVVAPDGTWVVSASGSTGSFINPDADDSLRLWDLTTGECLRTLSTEKSAFVSLALSPDGRSLISGSNDGTIRLWDLATYACTRTFHPSESAVKFADWTSDRRFLTLPGNWWILGDQGLRLWDVETGLLEKTIPGASSPVTLVPGGQTVVTNCAQSGSMTEPRSLREWSIETGECIRTYPEHEDAVTALAVSPDGSLLAVGDKTGSVRTHDHSDGVIHFRRDGHRGPISCLAWTLMPTRFLSGDDDGTIRLWDTDSGKCIWVYSGHAGAVTSIVCLPNGQGFVSCGHDTTLRVWSFSGGSTTEDITIEDEDPSFLTPTNHVAVARNGLLLVTANSITVVTTQLEPISMYRIQVRSDHDRITDVAINPAGNRLLIGSIYRRWDEREFDEVGGIVSVWDLTRQEQVARLTGHTLGVTSVAISSDATRGISGSRDGTLKLWDLDVGQPLKTLRGHESEVTTVAITPDGTIAVSGSGDETIKAWDLNDGRCIWTSEERYGVIKSVAITPDGRYALSASPTDYFHSTPFDRSVRVWDFQTGQCVMQLQGCRGFIRCIAVGDDGEKVVAGSEDGTLHVWDLATGQSLAIYPVPSSSPVMSCAVMNNVYLCSDQSGNTYFLRLDAVQRKVD